MLSDTFITSSLNNFLLASKQIPDFAIMGPYIQENRDINKSVNSNNLKPIITDNVKGFAMFLNLSKFKDVGFFDENIFFYFEEIDLCKRLIKSGKKIYLVPSIKIKHDGARSHDSYINEEMELSRNWHWMWSTFYYNKKYNGFFFALVKVSGKLTSAFLKIIFYTLFFQKNKRRIYYQRFLGLINSIFGKKSSYRPKIF